MATQAAPGALELELEAHRRALTGYCYRMLGGGAEAEDAVQETLLRAWRKADGLEHRAALKSWLYRIATNVCLDMLQGAQRRARPMDLGPAATAQATLDAGLPEEAWVMPVADARVLPESADPAELAAERESLRLAFVAALQLLPPRQRAVLILREVLRWQAAEVAELLETSVASVNSALQRARATLEAADADLDHTPGPAALTEEERALFARYVEAFEAYDVDGVVALLHDDVRFSMPPYRLWLRGPRDVAQWLVGPGAGCRGSRVIPVAANGGPAYAQYRRDHEHPGRYTAWALATLEIEGDRITGVQSFLQTGHLFPQFGLPLTLER